MDSPKYLIEEEEGIDLRKWFFLLLNHWYLFLIFLFVAFVVAFFYNKYTVREYQLSTSVLVQEDSDPLDKANMLRVSLSRDPYKLENEIGILNSNEIKKRTLRELDFFVEYYQEKNLKRDELYLNTPFVVYFDFFHSQPVDKEFKINYLSDSSILLSMKESEVALYNYDEWKFVGEVSDLEISDTIFFGDTVSNAFYKLWINANPYGILPGYKENTYYFSFRSLSNLSARYSNVKVDISKGSSIIELSLNHSNPYKAALYLNTLVDNYLLKGIERENKIAQRTIDFIDFQLTTLVDSLQISEKQLGDFRSSNKIVSIDYQAQQAYSRQTDLNKQKAELDVQKRYLEYLGKGLESNSMAIEELIAPSTLGINDAVLNNVVLELVEMYNERTELSLNSKRDNPYTTSLDSKIESQKKKLAETVDNILDATNISLDELHSQIEEVSAQLSKLPKDDQELLRFERKFQLNDELNTYLLTRRSEMQIKKASNIPSNEILDRAMVDEAVLVHPNKKISYLMALFAGFLFPFLIVYVRVIFNNKVQSHDDIKLITDIPVIGTVYNNDNMESPIVVNSPTSIIAESFRMLRANLQFVISDNKSPVFVVTSAMKGEGKSFMAINLAAVQSSNKKKVCLVDLDLRRPRLSEYLKIDQHLGMSNYLIGKAELNDIIVPINDGLFDLIPSGPIPPNPSELVASKKLEQLIETLQEKYDYIILDTPPIGMVSDAMFISKLAGYLLLIVRHNGTYKQLLSDLIEEIKRNKIKGVNLVYNDVPTGKKGYYRYGYRYGYYYSNEKKSFWSKIMG
jgi:tyrosine-protein kinase Etk/Wzc